MTRVVAIEERRTTSFSLKSEEGNRPGRGTGAMHAAGAVTGDRVDVSVAELDGRDAVERATGQRPHLPARVGDLFERDERYAELPGDYAAVAAYIAEHAAPSR